jgi:hypothetical protein
MASEKLKSDKSGAKASREERLAAALRANLKRRKAAKAADVPATGEPVVRHKGGSGPQSGSP